MSDVAQAPERATRLRRVGLPLFVVLFWVVVSYYYIWWPWAPWADRTMVSLWVVDVSRPGNREVFDPWGFCWTKNAAEGFLERNVPGDRLATVSEHRMPRVYVPSALQPDSRDGCAFEPPDEDPR